MLDEGFDPVTAAGIAVAAIIAMLPLFTLDLSVSAVFADTSGLVRGLAMLFAAATLPAAAAAVVSTERFRVEAFAAFAALPFAVLGDPFLWVGLGVALGTLFVSYKARSVFTGDNNFWTYFKAGGGMVTVLALVLGLGVAMTYQSSAEFRDDVQGAFTNETTEVAVGQVNATQQDLLDQQQQMLTTLAGQVAENVSSLSIRATEGLVFTAVDESGSFSDPQRQLLRQSFTTAEREIPPRVRDNITTRVEQQFEQRSGSLAPSGGVEGTVRSQVSRLVGQFAEPTPPVLAAIVIMVFSTVMIGKIPFSLLAGIAGFLLAIGISRLRGPP